MAATGQLGTTTRGLSAAHGSPINSNDLVAAPRPPMNSNRQTPQGETMTIVNNHRLGFVVVAALAAGLAPVAAIAAPPSTDDPGTSTPASGLWLDG